MGSRIDPTQQHLVYEALKRHLNLFWPERNKEEFQWAFGPTRVRLPRFRVVRVAPKESNEAWIYVSLGAWEAGSNEQTGLEFLITSPEETPRHIETLAMIANYHADPRFRLHIGDTPSIGHGWIEGSACDHLLVTLPYQYGPKFEICHVDNSRHVRFLWLVPITAGEASYVRDNGAEAFEARLEEAGLDVLDPNRQSVV